MCHELHDRATPFGGPHSIAYPARFNDCDRLHPTASSQHKPSSGSSTSGWSARIWSAEIRGESSSNGVAGYEDWEDIVFVSSSVEKHEIEDRLEDGEGMGNGRWSVGGGKSTWKGWDRGGIGIGDCLLT